MDKFHIGQKVIFVNRPSGGARLLEKEKPYLGKVGKIISAAHDYGDGILRYKTNLDGEIKFPIESALDPVYDGDEQSSWETCAWKPKDLVKQLVKAEPN